MNSQEEMYARESLNDLGTTMAYLGLTEITDTFVVTSPQTIFTLSQTPSPRFIPQLYIAGVLQLSVYTTSGPTLTLAVPLSSTTLLVTYWY